MGFFDRLHTDRANLSKKYEVNITFELPQGTERKKKYLADLTTLNVQAVNVAM